MWLYPGLTLVAIAMMLGIVAAMAFIPDQRLPLLFGVASAAVMLACYGVRRCIDALRGSRNPVAGQA
jgi:GABA permease